MSYKQRALEVHKEKRGKIEVVTKMPVTNRDELSLAYTPGVGEVSRAVAEDPERAYTYTSKGNMVAVVSDGSAVLGLGNIGPEAALPVMEGKAVLFKEFAGVDAFPIVLATQDVDEIVETVRRITPGFGGINLEDISAPRCFEIEARLQDLGIPVFHDDQHGTAIVALAALINAVRVVHKELASLKVVINGAGAAGVAIYNILKNEGVSELVVCDSKGILSSDRDDISGVKRSIAEEVGHGPGTLAEALSGADAFIGVSAPNVLTTGMIEGMNDGAIVFALANPDPEILPDSALGAGAAVVATGRSDFPNQINNVLAFPGIFRGALDVRAPRITEEMKVAAAHAIAKLVAKPTPEKILPNPFEKEVAEAVAEAVRSSI